MLVFVFVSVFRKFFDRLCWLILFLLSVTETLPVSRYPIYSNIYYYDLEQITVFHTHAVIKNQSSKNHLRDYRCYCFFRRSRIRD